LDHNNTNTREKGENKRNIGLVEGGNEVNKNVFLRRAEEENLSDGEPLRPDSGQLWTQAF